MATVVVMQCSTSIFMLIGSWKGGRILKGKNLLGLGYRKKNTL